VRRIQGFRGVLRVKGNGCYGEIMIGLYLNYVRTRAFFLFLQILEKLIEIAKLQFYRIK
jgi:hypothetical protein